MRGFNLDHLQAFVDVVSLGSFSAAADRRKLSQPAISQQVRALERQLGIRLVDRSARKASPTPAGIELLAHARRIDAAVDAAREAVAQHVSGAAGRIRLGTGATACIYLLPPALRELKRREPGLEIAVSTGNTGDMLKALEANGIDIGFVTLPVPARRFAVTPVLEDEFVLAAPARSRLPAEITPAIAATLPIVVYEPGAQTRRIIDDWFQAAGQSIDPIMELGSVEAIKKLVGAGLGCGILPGSAVALGRDRQGLVVRPLKPQLTRTLGIALRRDKPLTRGLRAVIEALTALGPRR